MKVVVNYIRNNPENCLFFILFLIAVITVGDYGISWDEAIQRKTGEINYNYVFQGDPSLLSWKDRDYGVAFELPLIVVEKLTGLTEYHDVFVLRHFLTHLFFLLSGLFLYKLVVRLFRVKWMALFAFALLVTHPVIYSHSFFNSKDIPFLSMFIIVLYFMVVALQRKKLIDFVWLGIITGVLIDIRLMGVIVPAILAGYVLVTASIEGAYVLWGKRFLLFLCMMLLTTVVCWPFLWQSPVDNFLLAFKNMSQFRWDDTVLFHGRNIPATEINWYYAPVWFAISTPIIYLLLGVVGLLLSLFTFIRKPIETLKNENLRLILMLLVFFIAPLVIVVLLDSVLYDAWRQLFFIYPAFIVAIIFAIDQLNGLLQKWAIGGLMVAIGFVLLFHIRQFPLQYVYFNAFVSHSDEQPLREKWETDYWCLSFSKALHDLERIDTRSRIKVAFSYYPGKYALDFLPNEKSKRFMMVDSLNDADYFIVVYRWHPHEYVNDRFVEIKSYDLEESAIAKIFKLK